jgi:hypothetical protein
MTKGAAIPQEMADALGKFSDESGRINDTIVNDLVSKREVPPVIYHYTNDLGLRGILETGVFWLTDIFNLNDPSELRHGFSHRVNPSLKSLKPLICKKESKILRITLCVRSAHAGMILDSGVPMQTTAVATRLGLMQKSSKMLS